MKTGIVVILLAMSSLAAPVSAGRKPIAPPPLPLEHRHPGGAFTFRTPEGWKMSAPEADVLEAWGGELGVRFLYRRGEAGYDSLHATCILEGLAPSFEAEPQLKYEYEFMSGVFAERRVLDTAHSVRYDRAVNGHRAWRQRTLTVVGRGESLCAMSYAPVAVWKKGPAARALLDAVLASVTFPQ